MIWANLRKNMLLCAKILAQNYIENIFKTDWHFFLLSLIFWALSCLETIVCWNWNPFQWKYIPLEFIHNKVICLTLPEYSKLICFNGQTFVLYYFHLCTVHIRPYWSHYVKITNRLRMFRIIQVNISKVIKGSIETGKSYRSR